MFCVKCGKEMDEKDKFCSSCGNKAKGVIDFDQAINSSKETINKATDVIKEKTNGVINNINNEENLKNVNGFVNTIKEKASKICEATQQKILLLIKKIDKDNKLTINKINNFKKIIIGIMVISISALAIYNIGFKPDPVKVVKAYIKASNNSNLNKALSYTINTFPDSSTLSATENLKLASKKIEILDEMAALRYSAGPAQILNIKEVNKGKNSASVYLELAIIGESWHGQIKLVKEKNKWLMDLSDIGLININSIA